MTNRERLQALLGFLPEQKAAKAALLDEGLEVNDNYEKANLPTVRKAAITVLETLLSTPDTGSSMTGWTAKYDRAAIQARLKALRAEGGSGATIRAVNLW